MELKEIIETQKKTIIFEDTEFENRQEISSANIKLDFYLELIGDYSGEIIIISKSDSRMAIFEEAINKNITIDFVPTGVLMNRGFDISIFENKVVLFNKCFDGMTSITNNTFINVDKITKISKKFIAIDTIGEGFLYVNYFPTLLKLLEVDANIDYYNVDKKTLNTLLLDNFIIMKGNGILSSISKNYWFDFNSSENQTSISFELDGFDVSDQIRNQTLVPKLEEQRLKNEAIRAKIQEQKDGHAVNYIITATIADAQTKKPKPRISKLETLFWICLWIACPPIFLIYCFLPQIKWVAKSIIPFLAWIGEITIQLLLLALVGFIKILHKVFPKTRKIITLKD